MLQAMQLTLSAESLCYTRASVRPSDCTPEGQVAQLVEHRTENAGVAGSIPALATIRLTFVMPSARRTLAHGRPAFGQAGAINLLALASTLTGEG